jgi:hypothetical protein
MLAMLILQLLHHAWLFKLFTYVQVAAQKRGACDVLKGPPRSSRDDPEFMNTFFKASRLHFIGTWKASRMLP